MDDTNQEISVKFLYQKNIWDIEPGVIYNEKQLEYHKAGKISAFVYTCESTLKAGKKFLIIRFAGIHREGKSDSFYLKEIRDESIRTEKPDGMLIDMAGLIGYTWDESSSDPMPWMLEYNEEKQSIPISVFTNEKMLGEIVGGISNVTDGKDEFKRLRKSLFPDFEKAWIYLKSCV
jgi:hypothetical protein